MTVSLSGSEVARQVTKHFPEAVSGVIGEVILLNSEFILAVAGYLKNSAELDFDYLTSITAIDYYHYFEVVYHLTSIKHNHSGLISLSV